MSRSPDLARQAQFLSAIRRSIARDGYPPTLREIGKQLGVTVNAARLQVNALERNGFIAVDRNTARGIRLVEWPPYLKTREGHTFVQVPVRLLAEAS